MFMNTLEDSKIIYLFVYVSDLQKARAFYEQKLEFTVLEEDGRSVKYDAGDLIYALNVAKDYGIDLHPNKRDNSSMIVFHVPDVEQMVVSLKATNIDSSKPLTYEVGTTSVFLDPDGHRLTSYTPSLGAMNWPSGAKIKDIIGECYDQRNEVQ